MHNDRNAVFLDQSSELRLEGSMDLISDLLRVIRLSGAVFFRAEMSTPWNITAPSGDQIASMFEFGQQRVVPFHVVVRGACQARAEGADPILLEEGDVVVFPHGHLHTLATDGASHSTFAGSLLPPPPYQGLPVISHGGGGSVTELVCGFLRHDDAIFNPLLASLPTVLAVGDRSEADAPPLTGILRFIEHEVSSQRPGSASQLERLTELMFVEVLRRHMEEMPLHESGWLAGLRDPFVGRTLQLIHEEPARDWSVESLSREVGRSRSALVERFTSLIGEPPMRYLTAWRMQLAALLLQEDDTTVATVAEQVGYGSEAAFSRAFRRVVGMPPATWSRQTA
jgi:AraC-like DNA-binding protein